jgi:hypothetical protein
VFRVLLNDTDLFPLGDIMNVVVLLGDFEVCGIVVSSAPFLT